MESHPAEQKKVALKKQRYLFKMNFNIPGFA